MTSTRSYKNADQPLQQAYRAAGGLNRIADAVNRKPGTVCGWSRVPPEHVLVVEAVSGIPRHVLRPDLYPAPEGEAA